MIQNRLNSEADMRLQLSSIKQRLQKYKIIPLFHHLFFLESNYFSEKHVIVVNMQ